MYLLRNSNFNFSYVLHDVIGEFFKFQKTVKPKRPETAFYYTFILYHVALYYTI